MSSFRELPVDVQKEVYRWNIAPKLKTPLDRSSMTFNGDDRNTYILFPEWILDKAGLTCLEFHIFTRLYVDGNQIQDVLMLDIPIMICGPNGPTEAQLKAVPPETTLLPNAPIEYLDQPKVLEAILSLEKKGLVIINREDKDEDI